MEEMRRNIERVKKELDSKTFVIGVCGSEKGEGEDAVNFAKELGKIFVVTKSIRKKIIVVTGMCNGVPDAFVESCIHHIAILQTQKKIHARVYGCTSARNKSELKVLYPNFEKRQEIFSHIHYANPYPYVNENVGNGSLFSTMANNMLHYLCKYVLPSPNLLQESDIRDKIRNVLLANMCDGIIAISGGGGTFQEVSTTLSLGKPVVAIQGVGGISDNLKEGIKYIRTFDASETKLFSMKNKSEILYEDTPENVFQYIIKNLENRYKKKRYSELKSEAYRSM